MDDDDSDGFGECPREAAPIFERPTNNSLRDLTLFIRRWKIEKNAALSVKWNH